jgi:hypothetical protein
MAALQKTVRLSKCSFHFASPPGCGQIRRASGTNVNFNAVVAVLFQEVDPPTTNGVRKPKKPGGKSMPSQSFPSRCVVYSPREKDTGIRALISPII